MNWQKRWAFFREVGSAFVSGVMPRFILVAIVLFPFSSLIWNGLSVHALLVGTAVGIMVIAALFAVLVVSAAMMALFLYKPKSNEP